MRYWLTALLILIGSCACGQADAEKVRFVVYNLVVDAGDNELAAWQMELRYDPKQVQIVGLEGDSKPPYYDRRGLKAGRIIIAGFSTSKEQLLKGRVRVCRLHLRVVGAKAPELSPKLITAATSQGQKFTAKIITSPQTGERE